MIKLIKEAKRFQELAGINEIKVEPPKREEYYIYYLDDLKGIEPPLGPFSLNKAKEKLKIYNAGLSYPEWDIMDAEEARNWYDLDEVKVAFKDNRKALGTVFYENPDTEEAEEYGYLYVWNDEFVEQLAKDLGFEDYKDVAGEFTHYVGPGTENDIRALEGLLGLENLTVDKLTVEMYKQAILRDFEKSQQF